MDNNEDKKFVYIIKDLSISKSYNRISGMTNEIFVCEEGKYILNNFSQSKVKHYKIDHVLVYSNKSGWVKKETSETSITSRSEILYDISEIKNDGHVNIFPDENLAKIAMCKIYLDFRNNINNEIDKLKANFNDKVNKRINQTFFEDIYENYPECFI